MARRHRLIALAGIASAGAAAAAWRLARTRDRAAVERDPERELLWKRLDGRPVTVTSADGTRLHVERFGPEQGPPIVLIHGWTEGLRLWTRQIQTLSARHPVIAYDLRGHGASESPFSGDFSLEALAVDLQAVLEATVTPPQRALLVGHSMGAMTIICWAGMFAADVSRRASGAVLCNTGVSGLAEEAQVLPLPSGLRALRAALTAAATGTALPMPPASPLTHRAIRHIALSRQASTAQVAFCEELILECRTDIRAGFAHTLAALDLTDSVSDLAVPTIIVAGEKDRLTPPVHGHRLAERLPDLVDLVEIRGGGHMSPVEASDQVTVAINRLADSGKEAGSVGRVPQEV